MATEPPEYIEWVYRWDKCELGQEHRTIARRLLLLQQVYLYLGGTFGEDVLARVIAFALALLPDKPLLQIVNLAEHLYDNSLANELISHISPECVLHQSTIAYAVAALITENAHHLHPRKRKCQGNASANTRSENVSVVAGMETRFTRLEDTGARCTARELCQHFVCAGVLPVHCAIFSVIFEVALSSQTSILAEPPKDSNTARGILLNVTDCVRTACVAATAFLSEFSSICVHGRAYTELVCEFGAVHATVKAVTDFCDVLDALPDLLLSLSKCFGISETGYTVTSEGRDEAVEGFLDFIEAVHSFSAQIGPCDTPDGPCACCATIMSTAQLARPVNVAYLPAVQQLHTAVSMLHAKLHNAATSPTSETPTAPSPEKTEAPIPRVAADDAVDAEGIQSVSSDDDDDHDDDNDDSDGAEAPLPASNKVGLPLRQTKSLPPFRMSLAAVNSTTPSPRAVIHTVRGPGLHRLHSFSTAREAMKPTLEMPDSSRSSNDVAGASGRQSSARNAIRWKTLFPQLWYAPTTAVMTEASQSVAQTVRENAAVSLLTPQNGAATARTQHAHVTFPMPVPQIARTPRTDAPTAADAASTARSTSSATFAVTVVNSPRETDLRMSWLEMKMRAKSEARNSTPSWLGDTPATGTGSLFTPANSANNNNGNNTTDRNGRRVSALGFAAPTTSSTDVTNPIPTVKWSFRRKSNEQSVRPAPPKQYHWKAEGTLYDEAHVAALQDILGDATAAPLIQEDSDDTHIGISDPDRLHPEMFLDELKEQHDTIDATPAPQLAHRRLSLASIAEPVVEYNNTKPQPPSTPHKHSFDNDAAENTSLKGADADEAPSSPSTTSKYVFVSQKLHLSYKPDMEKIIAKSIPSLAKSPIITVDGAGQARTAQEEGLWTSNNNRRRRSIITSTSVSPLKGQDFSDNKHAVITTTSSRHRNTSTSPRINSVSPHKPQHPQTKVAGKAEANTLSVEAQRRMARMQHLINALQSLAHKEKNAFHLIGKTGVTAPSHVKPTAAKAATLTYTAAIAQSLRTSSPSSKHTSATARKNDTLVSETALQAYNLAVSLATTNTNSNKNASTTPPENTTVIIPADEIAAGRVTHTSLHNIVLSRAVPTRATGTPLPLGILEDADFTASNVTDARFLHHRLVLLADTALDRLVPQVRQVHVPIGATFIPNVVQVPLERPLQPARPAHAHPRHVTTSVRRNRHIVTTLLRAAEQRAVRAMKPHPPSTRPPLRAPTEDISRVRTSV